MLVSAQDDWALVWRNVYAGKHAAVWKHHEESADLCAADDRRESAAAMLQHCGHDHCRAIFGRECAGGGGLGLHADGFSDVDHAGAVHGQRGVVFDQLRARRPRPAAHGDLPVLCVYRAGDAGDQCAGVCGLRFYHLVSARWRRGGGRPNENVSAGDLCGDRGDVFAELFFLSAARAGQFEGAAGFSGGERGDEHCAGSALCLCVLLGRGWRGAGDDPVAVGVGDRAGAVHAARVCGAAA